MSNWPDLGIVIVTYNRKETLIPTLQGLRDGLYYTGNKHIIVADDGSTDGTQDILAADWPEVILIQSNRVGMGANTNAGLRAALQRADFVLQMQDDMRLLKYLDLHPHVTKLQEDETAGFIRLWGVGGHRYEGALEGNHWRIWWHSPELYVPSDRPHLKHRRFHEYFGFYPEGLRTAETEESWCHHCKALSGTKGTMDVLVPLGDTETTWEHIGWHSRWRDQGL